MNLALRSKKKNGNEDGKRKIRKLQEGIEAIGAEINSRTEKYMQPHGFKGLLALGDSRKYPYHTTDGFSALRGQGGVVWTGIPKAWGGYLRVEFWRHGEGVRSGIYTGDRQEFIPWKCFFMDVLNQFVNRARTGDTSLRQLCRRSRMQDKHRSTYMCSFSLGKLTKCRFYFKLQRPYVD